MYDDEADWDMEEQEEECKDPPTFQHQTSDTKPVQIVHSAEMKPGFLKKILGWINTYCLSEDEMIIVARNF